MKLELKLTERDKKLISFLVLFLLIVGVGYFAVLPLHTKVVSLQEEAAALQEQVAQTQVNLSRLPKLQAENEALEQEKQQTLADFYPYMESQQLDQMITGLTLQQSLGAKNLTIEITDEPYVITPYFLEDSAEDGSMEESGETESEAAVETSEEDGSGEALDETDGIDETQILTVAKLSIDVTGTREKLQDYIDLLSDDAKYPAIQIDSYTWAMDNSIATDALGAVQIRQEEALHLELSVYMQRKVEA